MALSTVLLYTLCAPQEPPAVPEAPPHPGFTLPIVDGGDGSLADHLGRKTVVFHFASW